MGGQAEQVAEYVGEHYSEGISLAGALRLAVDALGHDSSEPRELTSDQLEVAVLDRTRTQVRKFKRISEETLARILSESQPAADIEEATAEAAASADAEPATSAGTSSASSSPSSSDDDDAPIAPPEDPDDSRPL
jgi:proteasome alpha subunit